MWNSTTKEAIQKKGKLFRKWQETKKEDDNIEYIKARRKPKMLVERAKENFRKDYGEHIT